ncbi:hypothetical protein ACSBR1_016350 [Camellia fascicularis]
MKCFLLFLFFIPALAEKNPKRWFDEYPQYLAVQLFVGGDSYSGITVPLVTKKIVDGNKDGVKPFMNLKVHTLDLMYGLIVIDENSKVVFAHRMALISDEIYENAKKGCNETYVNIDPANTACIVALGNIKTVKDMIHQAGFYVDVDTTDRTIQKKVYSQLSF